MRYIIIPSFLEGNLLERRDRMSSFDLIYCGSPRTSTPTIKIEFTCRGWRPKAARVNYSSIFYSKKELNVTTHLVRTANHDNLD